jgi:two-component system KDP operon response regulator KdpE
MDRMTSDGEPSCSPGTAERPPQLRPVVLVAQGDRRVRRQLRGALAGHDFRVIETATGAEALAQAPAHNPDLILLDFDLPDINGLDVTAKLREWSVAPILVLSARGEEAEKIAALDCGANDYVTIPLRTGELLARMRVWLRATQRARSNSLGTVLEVGDLEIDFGKRRASVCGREVALTPKQYKLLAMMMRNAGKVLSHEQILFAVWGPAYARETQYLRVYIGHLRRKFEQDPAQPQYFLTEPGFGYRLRAVRLLRNAAHTSAPCAAAVP